jgi:tetratricopeptide (TPR) repeat protein
MYKNKFGATVLISLAAVFSGQEAFAQARKAKTKAAAPAPVQSQAQKKKTIGELLRQADRGAALQQAAKQNIELPQTKLQLSERRKNEEILMGNVKPPRSSAFFDGATDDQQKLEAITDKQMQELYKLTQRFRSSPQRGELWLRLAELYVEKSGIIDFRKQGAYEAALADYQAKKTPRKPVLDLRDAKAFNLKAIQLYELFAQEFPKDSKMDQALFFLGYNYYELNKLDKGTAYYTRLIQEYPRSPYVVEANFALAEYYFENDNWAKAKSAYGQVLPNRKHRLYSFSTYKYAWCEFRLGNTVAALKRMESLVREGREDTAQEGVEGRKTVNRSKLESEGLRDIVLFYGEVGKPEQAVPYFKSLARQQADRYIERLAYYYGDKGNLSGARLLFGYLISTNPTSTKAFDYKYQVVRLYSTAKKSQEFREELFSWIRDFGNNSAWYQANQGNKEFVENAYKLREQTMRTYVLQEHQTAQNSRAPFSQGLALEGYRLYLTEFTDSPVIADMHFYYGELLYDMKKYEVAGAQYKWVVDNGKNSKFYLRALENQVLSFEKDLPKDDDIAARVGKSLDPIEIDARVQRFMVACIEYVQAQPNTDRALEMKFRIGRYYYQHNQFDKAIPYFKEIIAKHSKTKFGEYAANLLLDIYNLKKDYAGLEKTAGELLASPDIAGSKAGADIKDVMEKATFKKAQDLEVAKDYAGSAQQFELLAKKQPGSDLADSAMFNAAINYERAGYNDKAIAAHALILKSTQKSSEGMKVKSRRIVAKLYQDSGQLSEAARLFESAAKEAGKDPLAPNLYFNAAILNEAVGKNSAAIENYEAYFEKHRGADKVEALFMMATLYRRQKSFTKAIEKYEAYVNRGGGKPDNIVESAWQVFDLSRRMGKTTNAEAWEKRTLSLQRKYSTGANFAAKIKLEKADGSFQEFRRLKIPGNPARQQQVVQEKIAMVGRLNNELAAIIKLDSAEEIVGALSLLGQTNLAMGESLIGAPLPGGLTAEETRQYKAGIEKLAEPFFNKAKESFKAAVSRGSELDSYPKGYYVARQNAVKMDPTSFYDGGEISSGTRQGSWVGL